MPRRWNLKVEVTESLVKETVSTSGHWLLDQNEVAIVSESFSEQVDVTENPVQGDSTQRLRLQTHYLLLTHIYEIQQAMADVRVTCPSK